MRRNSWVAGVLSGLVLSSCVTVTQPVGETAPSRWGEDTGAAIEAVLARDVGPAKLPGAVVAAGDAHGTRFLKASGHLQVLPLPLPMPEDAIFDLASVTKVVGTTTAIMLLVDEGRLALTDPISKHIPEWTGRPPGEDVRVHHLLTHTSGLPAYLSVEPLREKHGAGPRPDVVISAIAGLRLRRAPGSGVEYSCLNAILAGRLAENVAGISLHKLLSTSVFQPLEMMDTGWFLTRAQMARLTPTGKQGRLDAAGALAATTTADPSDEGLVHDPLARYYTSAERCAGNAGLFSSAADLGRFARMILGRGQLEGHRVLRAETVDLFTRVQTPAGMETRGYGWDVWDRHPFQPAPNGPEECRAVGHFGFTGTMIWLDKGSGLWAVVLANRLHRGQSTSAGTLRRDVLRAIVEGTARHSEPPARAGLSLQGNSAKLGSATSSPGPAVTTEKRGPRPSAPGGKHAAVSGGRPWRSRLTGSPAASRPWTSWRAFNTVSPG
jgi:CubicO group peptidase (beta-lactamase class C family)